MYLIFVASLNENQKLANSIKESLDSQNIESKVINLVDLQLPMYDSYKEEHQGIPPKALSLIESMKESNSYIFVSPEYNFSIPPVLVNTIAWISRAGDDFRELFKQKTIQLATHSGSNGKDLCNAMRVQFTRLGSVVMPREIITSYTSPLNQESLQKSLEEFVEFSKD